MSELFNVGTFNPGTWVMTFICGGDGLDRFFADLARDWRGWKGIRTWKSLENALGFNASISRTGVVTLQVEMRNSAVFTWQLIYDITIENGQLDRLAADACRFMQSLGTAQG